MAESGKFYNVQLADQSASGKVYKVRDVTGEKNVSGKVYQVKGLGGGGGVTIKNQDKQITENGVYTADVGYTGLGTVNVNVASGSPTQKFGVTIDNFLGDVDADGNYVAPSEPFEVNLAGVKSIPSKAFLSAFESNKLITKFTANDLISFTGTGGGGDSFRAAFKSATNLISAEFNSIEEIPFNLATTYVFHQAFQYINNDAKVRFNKLKKIAAAGCFYSAFLGLNSFKPDEVFPVLEEISGSESMREICTYSLVPTLLFSRVKKITGVTPKTSCTFGGVYSKDSVWYFPSATEMTGYIWNASATITGEIHFAAANQAAIEACEGYDYKWGFAGATIYFDL